MSCKLGHPEFDAALEGSLDYLIHGFARWSCVFRVYSLGVSLKGPALVRFLVLKKKKIIPLLTFSLPFNKSWC
jgi:hypothetical protein